MIGTEAVEQKRGVTNFKNGSNSREGGEGIKL
jgi:hypothetical protein